MQTAENTLPFSNSMIHGISNSGFVHCNACPIMRRGVVASVVSLHERSYPTSGPVSTGMGDRLWAGIPSRYVSNQPTRSTQPCIPPGSLNRVPASAGVKAGISPLPGGRCDPIRHVSSSSGVATSVSELLYPCY